MGKKGGKKSKGMVVSKTKRANHLKQKKGYKAGGIVKSQQTAAKRKSYLPGEKNKPNDKSPKKGRHPAPAQQKSSIEAPRQGKGKKDNKTASRKPQDANTPIGDDFEADEMMDMMDDEDLEFLKKSTGQNGDSKKKRKRAEEIEDLYDEELYQQDMLKKKTKALLPIKTKKGVVERSIEVEDAVSDQEDEEAVEEEKKDEPTLSVAEMYARRKAKIDNLKTQIGVATSNILEKPEERLDSISGLLKLYGELTPDMFITGFKLLSASLVELFKDLAPGFEIKDTTNPGDRLKKTTREVYGNEARLLQFYQMFLKKLEDAFSPLKEGRKKQSVDEPTKRVGIFAMKCMSDLLIAMPHFNFSVNIVHALIPFTAHRSDEVRLPVCAAFKQLFKDDKKGEVSLHAVRQVNHMIKNKRNHQIPPDCLDILLALRIKDVNLDKEREEEIGRYKTLKRKEKLLIMSKNERRRHKKIERLEKEIVVAKAERNKGSKTKFQTETVKIVFTIYFRILKMAPKSALMGVVLQGLAKYSTLQTANSLFIFIP